MPPETVAQRVLAGFAEMRLTVETARRRARMYLADPASDKATSAEQALVEVLGILEGVRIEAPGCATCSANVSEKLSS